MKKPDYCTQNNGDCPTCSLANYGRDCQNNPIDYAAFAASALGRKGGSVKGSTAKSEAARAREEAKRAAGIKTGGRPKKVQE